MDSYTLTHEFAQNYVTEINNCYGYEDKTDVQREAKRLIRDLTRIMNAVDVLTMYDLTVSK